MEQKRNLFEIFMTHTKGEDKTDMKKKTVLDVTSCLEFLIYCSILGLHYALFILMNNETQNRQKHSTTINLKIGIRSLALLRIEYTLLACTCEADEK